MYFYRFLIYTLNTFLNYQNLVKCKRVDNFTTEFPQQCFKLQRNILAICAKLKMTCCINIRDHVK